MGALEDFAVEVGRDDPVAVRGGATQWDVGGPVHPDVRIVAAPAGVVDHRPEEMLVRVRAGTTMAELAGVLDRAGQMVPLDPADPERATVGGILSVGRAGLRRLRHGPVRDHVLEIRYVSAGGELVKAGAPVVKNVSGFDLVR
ncbi:MAG: FAD-binding oxidoreductase, partial [Acidimicrobiales bacterium]